MILGPKRYLFLNYIKKAQVQPVKKRISNANFQFPAVYNAAYLMTLDHNALSYYQYFEG